MNFDLPLTGTERVELHIHSGGQVFLGNSAPERTVPPAPLEPSLVGGPSLPFRLLTHGIVGGVCLMAGIMLAPQPHPDDLRPMAMRSSLYPVPYATPTPLRPVPDEPSDPMPAAPASVPDAVARQLAQPPVVTPPAASPRTAPGGSAFGLDN